MPPFELRLSGRPAQVFDTEEAAVAAASAAVKQYADAEPEVVDQATGRAAAPGASRAERDDLAHKVGY